MVMVLALAEEAGAADDIVITIEAAVDGAVVTVAVYVDKAAATAVVDGAEAATEIEGQVRRRGMDENRQWPLVQKTLALRPWSQETATLAGAKDDILLTTEDRRHRA